MVQLGANMARGIFGFLLFAPGGFYILATLFAIKAIKSGNLAQLKQEIKQLIKPSHVE